MTTGIPLVERMLLRDLIQDSVLRIIFIDNTAKTIWLCRIDDDSWPQPMPIQKVLEGLSPEKKNFVVEYDDPWVHFVISDKQRSVADERQEGRYAVIEPLITGSNERLVLFNRHRKELISKRIKEVNCSRQHITALLKLYWKRGMTIAALRTDYSNCGGPGKRRNPSGDKKIGAPRIITPGRGVCVNEDTRPMFQIGADYYFSSKKPSIQQALDYVISMFFTKKVKDGNGRIISVEVEPELPTARQFQYFMNTNYKNSHIRQKRFGYKNWDLQEREILGAADCDIQGPGDRFQIDATVADVYLVSQFDRRRIVGRPIIYFIIDVFSRLIAGLYAGFEGPSWIGAMMALVNMVTPKIPFCKQYGIDIDESDWPSHYAPKRIMGDRGELLSVALGKNITQSLRIDIENASPGRADLKALVERRFGIVPAKFRQFTPGYVEKDFNERGARDYRLDAALDLREFTQLLILAVLEHNFTPIRDKNLPADMVTDGLSATPLDLWQWGIINRSGCLKALTIEEVALNVMPTDKARVTGKGIYFKGSYYSCDTAVRDEWYSKARQAGWSVTVSYDPRSMDIVYLRDTKLPRGFEICKLLEKSYANYGKSLFEMEELALAKKRNEAASEIDRQSKRTLIREKMAEIESTAKRNTNEVNDSNVPKSKITSDIRASKAQEKETQREAEVFEFGDEISSTNSDLKETSSDVDMAASGNKILSLLRDKRKLREMKNDQNI